jgi:hypothetical protein
MLFYERKRIVDLAAKHRLPSMFIARGNVIVRRQLKRRYVLPFFEKLPPCLNGIEGDAPH